MNDSKRARRSLYQSINNYPYYGNGIAQANLQASCKNSLDFVQRLDVTKTLNLHSGCVNTVNWNASGTHFVSGSDDNHLVVTEFKSGHIVAKTKTMHKRHIFSARFMPHTNDQAIVSCSGEGVVIHTEFLEGYGPGSGNVENVLVGESGRVANLFDCHAFGSAYDVQPLVDCPRTFLSCGEDGTVRCIDLRVCDRCSESVCEKHIFITAPCAVTAMDVAPINPNKVAIGCADSIVRIYDRRMLGMAGNTQDRLNWPLKAYPIPMKFTRRHYRPTCVKFSDDESELLVSYSMEQVYLFDLQHPGYNDEELLNSGCYTPKLRREDDPEPQTPRLRFRGDWSDTGPHSMANAEGQGQNQHNVGQARPSLEPGVLGRLNDEIFRMLSSQHRPTRLGAPSARIGSSGGLGAAVAAAAASAGTGGSSGIGIGLGSGIDISATTQARSINNTHITWHGAVLRTLEMESSSDLRRRLNRLRHSETLANSPPSPSPSLPETPDMAAEEALAAEPKPLAPIPEVKEDSGEGASQPTAGDAEPDAAVAAPAASAAASADGEEPNGEQPKYPLTKFDYVKMSFRGHRNSRTMVKGACFWGDDFIMSGSDCGHIFVWQRQTGKVVKTMLADNRVVNRVQPHPTMPYLLSSGIDYNVKMWAPIGSKPTFDEAETAGLIKSNEIMLVKTRDIITVPAQIMIRILASLHQYRRLIHSGGEVTVRPRPQVQEEEEEDDDEDDDDDDDDEDDENDEEENELMDTDEHVAVVEGVIFDLSDDEEEEEPEEQHQMLVDEEVQLQEHDSDSDTDTDLNNANTDCNQMSN